MENEVKEQENYLWHEFIIIILSWYLCHTCMCVCICACAHRHMHECTCVHAPMHECHSTGSAWVSQCGVRKHECQGSDVEVGERHLYPLLQAQRSVTEPG